MQSTLVLAIVTDVNIRTCLFCVVYLQEFTAEKEEMKMIIEAQKVYTVHKCHM